MIEHYGIILFPSTKMAMSAERLAKKADLKVRIISTPQKLRASCGFSLKYELSQEEALLDVLRINGIEIEGYYHACQQGLKVTYDV
ncbi:MAG: DUF3343 domain-containing protein [Streptococcaceae bacterium]|nr:DUF3343 domain-containing protein [Streptococcaceae bacterium]